MKNKERDAAKEQQNKLRVRINVHDKGNEAILERCALNTEVK